MSYVWSEDNWQDIGGGVEITPIRDGDTGEQVGLLERHTCAEGRLSRGAVPFVGYAYSSSAGWTVEQAEPLTLSPSIACRSCSNHGWIRNGEWVSA